ncbi:MAG TPA: N-6 DNA methylase [Gemmataceae bacterium]|nr:N-6 DNA methylase [Gemmataceae bacterium]
MAPKRPALEPPPCYALVIPGLETVAAEEINRDLGGKVKRTAPGMVVFRADLDKALLKLLTIEDVFLFAWGTDKLTHRAEDLERIRRWTTHEVAWDHLLRIHHTIHPKPKGKTTYHLVAQMNGKHVYRRIDALKAMARGLEGKLPASWRPAEENASVEVWLTINGSMAVCGLRLSDRSMRHRTYKLEHVPASLRPTVASAMIRLAAIKPGNTVADPMCGAGTILAEGVSWTRKMGVADVRFLGGDLDRTTVRKAITNLSRLGAPDIKEWNALHLPLDDGSLDRIVSNPPFGKQLSRPEDIGRLYQKIVVEYDRVLKADGRAVLLVSDFGLLKEATKSVSWRLRRQLRIRVLGQPAVIGVWQKTLTEEA